MAKCICVEATQKGWCWGYKLTWKGKDKSMPDKILCAKCGKDLTDVELKTIERQV